jgi:hypothetical protein
LTTYTEKNSLSSGMHIDLLGVKVGSKNGIFKKVVFGLFGGIFE